MPDEEFVFGVDLDGVVADFYKGLRPIAAEWLGKPEDELSLTAFSFGLAEWGVTGEDYERIHRYAVVEQELFANLDPIGGAAPALRRLSNDGIRIRIITHRLFVKFTHETTIGQTVRWLESVGVPYWDLCFMRDKGAVGADLYVDDSQRNVEALRSSGHNTIVFTGPTNGGVADPRADNWTELERMVRESAGK